MSSISRLPVLFGLCLSLAVPLTAAGAAPCRDANGKFVTCPKPAAKQKCRDAKGKFTACTASTMAPK